MPQLSDALLDGKVVLVSGGTQGLGAAVAAAAVRNGADVVVTGRRKDVGEQFAAELVEGSGRQARYVQADAGDVGRSQAAVAETIDRFGRIDCVVNCAGLTTRGTVLDTTPELFDAHVAVNLRGPFFLMQAAIKDMVARGEGGAIVNIISMSAHGGQPYLAPYVASKAGLIGLTRNVAFAHRWDRIRVNGVNIGWTETEGEDLTQRRFHDAVAPPAQTSEESWIMRIGLIGVGRIGAFHAQTLTDLEAVDELIVTDAVPDLARRVGERLNVSVAPEPADLLAAGIDGVVIASSTATHPDLIRAFVRAGIPTFCEKPVAVLSTEAVALRDELADVDTPIQIGFPRRFDAAYMAARADVVAGRLGYVHTVRSTTLDPAPPPEAYIRGSGGIFNDCSIHDFDSVRYVTGQEVVEVYAAGTNQGVDYIEAAGDAETVTSILTLSGGTLAVVSNSRSNGRGHDVRLELLGSKDSVAAGLDDRLPLRSADPTVAFPSGTPWDFFMDRFANAFRAELTAFTEVVAGTRPSPCTLHDGVEASIIAEAATRSWREHRPVRVDEVR